MTKDEGLKRLIAATEGILEDDSRFVSLADQRARWDNRMDEAREAVEQARAALSQPDWTRIEDMPEEWKDGRELLGYREDCGQFLMKWTDADEFIPEGKEEEHGCDGEWEFECDWFIPDTGYRISNDGDPTHVRELPPPPKGKQP